MENNTYRRDISDIFKKYIEEHHIICNIHYYNRLIKLLNWAFVSFNTNSIKKIHGYETHHIIPRSWDKNNHYSNLIHIPLRIHYLIHKLMHKSFPLDIPMMRAFYLMSNTHGFSIKNSNSYLKIKEKWIMSFKDEFKSGRRISCRKNHVMCRDIRTNKLYLVPSDEYYKSIYLKGMGYNRPMSDVNKIKIKESLKNFKKTEVQKDSAKKLMHKLCKNKILCNCCNKYFNYGNYAHHKNGAPNKGLPHKDSTKNKIRNKKLLDNKLNGTIKYIHKFNYENTEYITYDLSETAKLFKISLPTFRKRYDSKIIGSHRKGIIIKIYNNYNINDYLLFK